MLQLLKVSLKFLQLVSNEIVEISFLIHIIIVCRRESLLETAAIDVVFVNKTFMRRRKGVITEV